MGTDPKLLETKHLEIGLTDSYWHKWTEDKAIEEIVSNAIDNSTDISRVKIYNQVVDDYGVNQCHLIIENDKIMPTECLLLGQSYSREDKSKIGMFGEGLKAAALLLSRDRKHMVMYTGKRKIYPELIPKEFEDEDTGEIKTVNVLRFTINKYDSGLPKTVVVMETDIQANNIKRNYLHFRNDYSIQIRTSEYGQQIKESGKKNYLYIKGKRIKELSEALYSYNFETDDINRDRDIVDESILKRHIGNCINYGTKTISDAVKVLRYLKKEDTIEALSFKGFYLSYEDTRKAYKQLWGDKACLQTDNPNVTLRARHNGYIPIKYPHNVKVNLHWCGIPYDSECILERDKFKWVKATSKERSLISKAIEILMESNIASKNGEYELSNEGIKNYLNNESIINVDYKVFSKNLDSDGIQGVTDGDTIGIKRDYCQNLRDVLNVLAHEVTHWLGNTDDNTDAHDTLTLELLIDVIMKLIEEKDNLEFEARVKENLHSTNIVVPVKYKNLVRGKKKVKVKLVVEDE